MLGQVRDPDPVRCVRDEPAADEVVMRGGAGLGTLAALGLAEHRPPLLVSADPPHHPVRHHVAGVADFIGEEPVSELRVVAVRVEDRLRQPRFGEITVGDRFVEPSGSTELDTASGPDTSP